MKQQLKKTREDLMSEQFFREDYEHKFHVLVDMPDQSMTQYQELLARFSTTLTRNNELNQRLNEALNKNEKLESANERLRSQNDKMNQRLDEVLNKNDKMNQRLDEVLNKNDKIERQNEKLLSQNAILDHVLQESQELKVQNQELKIRNQELDARLTIVETELATLKAHILLADYIYVARKMLAHSKGFRSWNSLLELTDYPLIINAAMDMFGVSEQDWTLLDKFFHTRTSICHPVTTSPKGAINNFDHNEALKYFPEFADSLSKIIPFVKSS